MAKTDLDAAETDLAAAETKLSHTRSAFIARGHEIIADGMQRARALALHYPAVGAFIPHIEQTLKSLFAHTMQTPAEFAAHEAAIEAHSQVDAAAAETAETQALNAAELARATGPLA